jgi:hypothetical protein
MMAMYLGTRVATAASEREKHVRRHLASTSSALRMSSALRYSLSQHLRIRQEHGPLLAPSVSPSPLHARVCAPLAAERDGTAPRRDAGAAVRDMRAAEGALVRARAARAPPRGDDLRAVPPAIS